MNTPKEIIKFRLHRREDCWKAVGWDLTIRRIGETDRSFHLFTGVQLAGRYSTLWDAKEHAPKFVTTKA